MQLNGQHGTSSKRTVILNGKNTMSWLKEAVLNLIIAGILDAATPYSAYLIQYVQEQHTEKSFAEV